MLSTHSGTNRGTLGRIAKLLLLALALLIALPNLAFAEAGVLDKVETQDTNIDGHLDHLKVTFSTAPDCAASCTFTVSPSSYTIKGVSNSGSVYTIELNPINALDTGATPSVTWNGTTKQSLDTAPPVLLSALGDDYGSSKLFNAGIDSIGHDTATFQFSELVKLVLAPSTTDVGLSTPDASLALERALYIAGDPTGCGTDGDGVTGRNFPSISVSAAPGTTQQSPFAFNAAHTAIVVTEQTGNDGSTSRGTPPSPVTDGHFLANPADASAHCTVDISGGTTGNTPNKNNIIDAASNAVVALGGHAMNVNHVLGTIAGQPGTVDANTDGKIDGVTLKFSHPVKLDTVQTAIVQGLISVTDDDIEASNIACSACAAATPTTPASSTVTISFAPDASWNTETTPTVTYVDPTSGGPTCAIRVVLTTTLSTCAAPFEKASLDKAPPALLQAKTLDVATPDGAGSNGRLDGVELSFSEPVSDASFGTGAAPAGWSVTGYVVSGFSTGSAADDAVVRVLFSEVVPGAGSNGDTEKTLAVAYAVPSSDPKAADKSGNLLAATSITAGDGAGPALVKGTVYDTNADGSIDQADFTFSEAVVSNTVAANAAKFLVDKGGAQTPATSAHVVNTDPFTVNVSIDGGVLGTEAKDLTSAAGAVSDAASNASALVNLPASVVSDQASPIALNVTPTGQNSQDAVVTITFSEPMDTTAAPTVTYGLDEPFADKTITAVADENHTNGFQKLDVTKWEGNATSPESCGALAGCENHIKVSGAKGLSSPTVMADDTHLTWTIDNQKPDAPAISAPSQNAVLVTAGTTRTVTLSGTTDPDDSGLTINVYEGTDTTPKAQAIVADNGAWSVAVANLGLGSHTLTAEAKDAGGNISDTRASRTFFVKQLPSLSIARSASSVVYGGTVRLTGALTAGGEALAGRRVTIQQQPYGSSTWSNLATLTTNSSGGYSYTAKPLKRTTYRAVFGGETTLANVTSSSALVLVKVVVSIAQSASSVTYGRYVTFSGTVSPNQAGKRAYLQIKNSNGTWSTLTYRYLDSKSHYSISYKPTSRGTRYYRVYIPYTTSQYIGNTSAYKYVRVS